MKRLIFTFLINVITLAGFAQDDFILLSDLSVINLEDGRKLHRFTDDNKTPLNGRQRIIGRKQSEYVIAEFTDGLYDGVYELYKYNKIKEKGTYIDGRRHGEYTEYYSSEAIPEKKILYEYGKRHGISRYYFVNGKLEREKCYFHNVEDGIDRKYNYETGKMTSDMFFKNGKPEGRQVYTLFSNIGNYTEYVTYSNGVKTGVFAQIFEDESLKTLGSYNEEGKKDGEWYERDSFSSSEKHSTGKLTIYENGEIIKEKELSDFDGFWKKRKKRELERLQVIR